MDQIDSARPPDLDLLWNAQDPAASEALFRKFVPDARELKGIERSLLVELLALIARAEGAQGKITEAHATLDEAARFLEEEKGAFRVSAKIRWLLEQGRIFILAKTPARARALFSQAWTLAVNSGDDFFTVDVARMMATIEPPKAQEEWILKAIEIAEKSPQDKARRWLGSLYASLSWKFYDVRQFEKALEAAQQSLRHFRNFGNPREIFVARWTTGKILRQMQRHEEALLLQKALLSELGMNHEPAGRLYEEIAECLTALQKTEEATMYFELAYKELSSEQWLNDNQPRKLKRLKDLGKVK